MPAWQDSIRTIVDGTSVNAGTTNAPLNAIIGNLLYLKALIDSGLGAGSAIVDHARPVRSDVVVGTPVWWNNTAGQFEPAQAVATLDTNSGTLVASANCNVVGVCLLKLSATSADVLLGGKAVLNIAGVTDTGATTAGRYYLSATVAGKLTLVRPPITVAVLYGDGAGSVYVLPQLRDFALGDHIHHAFDLTAMPAGDTVAPPLGGTHSVINPNPAVKGWLPATHASFNGLAPAGAFFGYNFLADTSLASVWPPVPLTAYTVEVVKYNPQDALEQSAITVNLSFLERGPQGAQGAQGAQGSVIGSQGVQGVQTGPQGITEGGVGFETDEIQIPYPCALIGDTVFLAPLSDPGEDLLWDAYVKKNGFVTVRLGSTLDQKVVIPFCNWVIKLITPASRGCGTAVTHAPIDPVGLVRVDNNGIWWMSNCYGDCPWPTSLSTLTVGPIQPQYVCRPDQMSIKLSFARYTFGTALPVVNSLGQAPGSPVTVLSQAGTAANNGNLLLGLNLKRELPARVVQLTVADEQTVSGIHFWRFPAGQTSTVRYEFEVPTAYLGTAPTVAVRMLLYGAAAGTLGNLGMTYRRIPRPASTGAPFTPPAFDTPAALVTNYTVTNGQVVEAVSEAVPVAPGDVLMFSLTRSATDGYPGDAGLVRAQGVLTSN